jgi:secretion/DNA translocation related CpaE-like protein
VKFTINKYVDLALGGAMSDSTHILLLVTADSLIINSVRGIVEPLGIDVQVVGSPLIARDIWESSAFVLVGSDLAGECVENLAPRRSHLIVVHNKEQSEGEGIAQPNFERDIWRHAVALGAENVLELPAANFWLVDALSPFVSSQPTKGILGSNVISVIGGSGGAGASTFAVNLAAIALSQGMASVVIDLDRFGGGIDLILGAEEISGTRWPDIDPGAGRIAEDTLRAALPKVNGVTFLSQSRTASGEVTIEVIAAVVDAARRAFDLVVLDLPREHSECNDLLIGQSLLTCVITRNHVRSIAASISLAQWVRKLGNQTRFVVISDSKGLGLPDVCGALGDQGITEIPFMPAMTTRADEGDPPGINSGYRDVCQVLLGEVRSQDSKSAA